MDDIDTYYNLDKKCKCKKSKQDAIVINYDQIWHDGDVVCKTCKCKIRNYDAG